MRILTLHSDSLEVEAKSKAIKDAEEIKGTKQKFGESLVVFTAVEKRDEVNPDAVAENTAREVKSVAEQVKVKSIVLYPYVHLTSNPSKPLIARNIMRKIQEFLGAEGFEVDHAPFGYYKSFKISVKGHPLSELSREISAEAKAVSKKKQEEKHTHGEPHAPKEEREHIRLGKELDVFHMQPEIAPGFPFYPPNGVIIRNALIDYMKKMNKKNGWQEVWTPHVFKIDLWKTSGHLEGYLDRMYLFEKDGDEYGLKPMNCPGHIMILQRKPLSYRDLPVKYSEFGTLYRYEQSGELTGVLRVRALTQDDGHAFIREDQIEDEVSKLIEQVRHLWLDVFKFSEIRFMLSTRAKPGEEKDQKYIGDLKVWEKAAKALREALDKEKIKYEEKSGEAAFYGPKIDVDIKDSVGTWWQCSTIQLDFMGPERFDLNYTDEKGGKRRLVMVHRAIYGSLDRFMGILLEHFKDKFPPWLSPLQVKVLPISDKSSEYANNIFKKLKEMDIRADIDLSNETLNKKIVNAHKDKAPYMLIVGEKEAQGKTIVVRDFNDKQRMQAKLDDFINHLLREIESKEVTATFVK